MGNPLDHPFPLIPIARQDAYRQGKARFYTGKACKYGHLAERFVSSGACCHCHNFPRVKSLAAPNAHMPPTGYLFPASVQVTPELMSAVHGEVLATLGDIVNKLERDAGRSLCKPGFFRMLPKADGLDRMAFITQGWTDRQLMADGYMAYAGTNIS